ncbi:hypothetical protein ACP70R_021046 [Stipagrostis hirtigluma subsp. patula]
MAASSAFADAALAAAAPVATPCGAAPVRLAGAPRGRRVARAVRCSAGQGGLQAPSKLAELWAAAKGAPPLSMLAAAVAAVAIYKVGSGLLAPPPPPPRRREEAPAAPIPEPVQVGEITEEELRQYDGSDPEKPLLMAIKGQIYDVSQSRMFYGPGGSYEMFAGRDASRALAKMSFEPKDLTGDISGLTPMELGSLNDWEYKFTSKYVKVGTIRRTTPTEEGHASIQPEIREEASDPKPEPEPEPEPISEPEAEPSGDDAP